MVNYLNKLQNNVLTYYKTYYLLSKYISYLTNKEPSINLSDDTINMNFP